MSAPRSMLQFTHLDRAMPAKRPAAERKADFAEIYRLPSAEVSPAQASRCEQCGIPFCSLACPLGNNIPDWLMLCAKDRMEEAYETASRTNSFPEICGRICPQDRLCEGRCVLEQSKHGAVTIGSVETYITEHAFAQGWVRPPIPDRERGKSVGIIGSGPAGLAAAGRLRQMGYAVTLYERQDRLGGLLLYGIPSFKLEKSVVQRRVELLQQAGVEFKTGVTVGQDVSFADLRSRHDAVLIATGVYKARRLGVLGDTLDGVYAALDYLTAQNRADLGENGGLSPLNAKGKDVVVIGGGDTAMDCVRTALRQGATSVKCLYRRDRANMPGSRREVANAEEEGAEFVWMAAPEAVLGTTEVTGVRAVRMHLGLADASGRQAPAVIPDSGFTLPADMVIEALGFEAENLPNKFACPDLKTDRWGNLLVDQQGQTSLAGVFAAGDIARGASLVVWAVRDGQQSAIAIDQYLSEGASHGAR